MNDFTTAVTALQAAPDGSDMCPPFLSTLPVTGVGISTLGNPLGSGTVCASDARAERIDEIQFDLGEGPCWQALSTRRPVLESDLSNTTNTGPCSRSRCASGRSRSARSTCPWTVSAP
jgi:hypothetical protein